MKSPVALLRNLLIDISRFHNIAKCLDRDILTIESRFEHEGMGFLTHTLPALSRSIIDGLESGRFLCPRAFKKAPGKQIPAFLQGIVRNVFDPETGLLLECSSESVQDLLQILGLFSKVVSTPEHEDILHAQGVKAFLENEATLVNRLDPIHEYRLRSVSRLLLQGLNRFNPCDLVGKHGPGAVSEGLTENQKWSFVFNGITQRNSILSRFGYEPRVIQSLESCDYIFQADMFHTEQCTSEGSARLVLVPKDSTSLRAITVEPCLNQFVQQGLNYYLRKEILSDPCLSQCLALSDQSKNNYLAKIGSLSRSYATIDLKSASDRISLALFASVFDCHASFYDSCMLSRTRSIQIDDNIISMNKYAGMGNATTFPVQSVIFSVLCAEAMLLAGNKRITYRNVKRALSRIRVYGDDIIIPSEFYAVVTTRLASAGLIVNTRKSFLKGYFRESCGTDFYKGEHVRPLYVRYLFGSGADERALGNLVSIANEFHMRCFYKTSDYIKRCVHEFLGYELPYIRSTLPNRDYTPTTSEVVALGWISRFGLYTLQRVNRSLHRPEVKTVVLVPQKRNDPLDSYPGLLRSFHVPIEGRGPGSDLTSVRRYATKAYRRWVAC